MARWLSKHVPFAVHVPALPNAQLEGGQLCFLQRQRSVVLWQRLHRLIYVSAICGVLYYWWLVKAHVRQPQIYATLIGLLLLYRLVVASQRALTSLPRHHRMSPGTAQLFRSNRTRL